MPLSLPLRPWNTADCAVSATAEGFGATALPRRPSAIRFIRKRRMPQELSRYISAAQKPFTSSYQGFRSTRDTENLLTVPTDANLRGDLSELGVDIFNPFTSREDPNNPGQFIRDAYPNNVIPQGELNAGMVAYAQQLFPAGEATGVPGKNNIDSTPINNDQDEWSVRIFSHRFRRVASTSRKPLPRFPAKWCHRFPPYSGDLQVPRRFVLSAIRGRLCAGRFRGCLGAGSEVLAAAL